MIRSYWLRILLCGIAAAIVGFLIGIATPPQYDAIVQVMVAPYNPNMGQPQSEADQSVQDIINSSAPRTVATQVETLTSLGVLSEAAQNVAQTTGLPWRNPGDELNPIDLQDKIAVNAAKESDMVTLRVRMPKPEWARDIAQAMYQAFVKQNELASKGNAENAIKFLTVQSEQNQKDLDDISKKESAAKVAANSADITVQVQSDFAALRDLETQVASAKADRVASETRAQELQRQFSRVPEFVQGGTTDAENPEYSMLIQQLGAAQADRDQALTRYMPDSEVIKSLDSRIEGLRNRLKNTPRYAKAQTSKPPNTLYYQLKQEVADATALAAAAATRMASLEAAVAEKKADLQKLPEIQQKLDALASQKAVLMRISQLYTSKLQTLKVAGAARQSQTQLVTPATAIQKPAIPNFPLNVGLGLFLGLAIGFLWSVGTESKRNPVRSLGQLNRLALQPCYRVVPELRVPMRGLSRPPADVYDSLLVNFIRSEKKGYRLGVVGVTKNAGASTAAMNLAISAAQSGRNVLFVEVDPGNSGLGKLAPTAAEAKGVSENISIYNATGDSASIEAVEAAAVGKDLIIYDFPPVKSSGEAFRVANALDEMVVLVRANVTKSVDFLQTQQALIDAGCPVVSVTLSRVADQSDDISSLEQQAEGRAITPQA
jgi:uncharacterized protein involved in exopolysaccharide biosynthesis